MHYARSKIIPLTVTVVSLLCVSCSSTDTQSTQSAVNPVDSDGMPILTVAQKEEGMVCKREAVTGTRISKKICTTKEQRDRQQQQAQQDLRDNQRINLGPTITE
jgi:hypothetical protein